MKIFPFDGRIMKIEKFAVTVECKFVCESFFGRCQAPSKRFSTSDELSSDSHSFLRLVENESALLNDSLEVTTCMSLFSSESIDLVSFARLDSFGRPQSFIFAGTEREHC